MIQEQSAQLDAGEAKSLERAEQIIGRSLVVFAEVGRALALIRDGRLYRMTHSAFEDYCRDRWNINRQRASQFILGAEIEDEVSGVAEDVTLANESAARELRRIPAEYRPAVVQQAAKTATKSASGIAVVRTGDVRAAASSVPRARTWSVTDSLGRAVEDPDAARAIEQYPKFRELVNRMHALKREALKLAETPLGREIRTQVIERAAADFVSAMEFAAPYTTCPLGTNCARGCKLCEGTRWINRRKYDALEESLK